MPKQSDIEAAVRALGNPYISLSSEELNYAASVAFVAGVGPVEETVVINNGQLRTIVFPDARIIPTDRGPVALISLKSSGK